MNPAFELKNVSKKFKRSNGDWNTALSDVSFKIQSGEFLAIIGPSGAGKTTLMRLLNLTLRPSEGEIILEGQNPSNLNAASLRKLRTKTGSIYQQFDIVPSIRVIHNILSGKLPTWSFLKSFLSLIYPIDISSAAEVAEKVGILECLWEKTSKLSGGEQQRVAIARTLIQNPSHILADEPVASVDPSRADSILILLKKLSEENKTTLVVNIHDIALALKFFPRIIGIRNGKIEFDLNSKEITKENLQKLYEGDKEFQYESLNKLTNI